MRARGVYLSTATAAVLGGALPGIIATFFGQPLAWWAASLVLASFPLLLATTALGGWGTRRERQAVVDVLVRVARERDSQSAPKR